MTKKELSEEHKKFIDDAMSKMTDVEKAALFKVCEKIVEEQNMALLTPMNLQIGEATILEALTEYGYSRKELKELMIKFGDVGSVGEYVKLHPRQTKMTDFFK